MVDLASEMTALAARLGPPPGAVARVVQFVAAESGAGTSTVARAFALQMAKTARRGVWLIELDLMKGEQHAHFAAAQKRYGALGEAAHASPNGAVFFAVTPPMTGADGKPWPDVSYMAAHSVGKTRLWVTRFRREAMKSGQTVKLLRSRLYWDALRPHADYVVIDAPSADRSAAARAIAPAMDANVLVVSAGERNVAAATALRDNLTAAGGRCAGMVLTRAPAEPPDFLKRIMG